MKPGMKIGQIATIEVEVTPDMFASFGGTLVHPAYSTASMVQHMEWASRMVLLPFLEEDEEGMGAAVTIKHIAPSTAGASIKVTATLSDISGNLIFTQVEASNEKGLIGVGEIKQVVLPKKKIHHLLNS